MLEECDHLNINMYCCQKGGLGVVDLVVYVVCMCLCVCVCAHQVSQFMG